MSQPLRRVLGRNLKRLRLQRRLSQEAFADKAGIHRTYVGGIESGTRNITLETLERDCWRPWRRPRRTCHLISDRDRSPGEIARAIGRAGINIYESLDDRPSLYYQATELQTRLREELIGKVFTGPIRSRSLLAKRAVAAALGYPAPASFARTRPRFPGQNLDVAVQYSDNFQVFNDEVDPLRRYAFLRPDSVGRIIAVRVVTGDVVVKLDTTGTLTSKYQASRLGNTQSSLLVSKVDTDPLRAYLGLRTLQLSNASSTAQAPRVGYVLPIEELF